MTKQKLLTALNAATTLALVAACGGNVELGGGESGGNAGSSGGSAGSGSGGGGSGGVTPSTVEAIGTRTKTDKVDLLFVVDNSSSMADKQEILRVSAQNILEELSALGAKDVHVGVITSSLGGAGADSCSTGSGGMFNPTMDDGGRLITRDINGFPRGTYQGLGFLVWDPEGRHSPPGDPSFDHVTVAAQELILGAGELGCGFEQPLEAWYRFLVDPEPYSRMERVPCFEGDASNGCAKRTGIDQQLLDQRSAFLRPDSAVAIVMLTDENDCSTIAGGYGPEAGDVGQFFISLQASQGAQPFHLPRPTAECAMDPNDPCCRSCGQPSPSGCPDNSEYTSCQTTGGFYDNAGNEDQLNLRCFDQKRRFGIDFLYPTERYVDGLRHRKVPNGSGQLVANPLYRELNAGSASARGFEMVFLMGIVGVPWQLIATEPSLTSGRLEYLSESEIRDRGLWDQLVGDPSRGTPPGSSLMVESPQERGGNLPSTSPTPLNAINGHEWNIADNDDLQYACIFPLVEPRDCNLSTTTCDCTGSPGMLATFRKPLCQDPATGEYTSIQRFAKAYPSLRPLEVLRGFGENSVVASICARNVTDASADDFAYRPAMKALARQMARAF